MMMILLILPMELRLLLTKQIWRLSYYPNSQLEAAEIMRLLGKTNHLESQKENDEPCTLKINDIKQKKHLLRWL